jgi:hypothetical protein
MLASLQNAWAPGQERLPTDRTTLKFSKCFTHLEDTIFQVFLMYAWNNLLLIKRHIFLLLYVFQREPERNNE